MPQRIDSNMTPEEFTRVKNEAAEGNMVRFARELGISKRNAHRYQNGDTTIPETVAILARRLHADATAAPQQG